MRTMRSARVFGIASFTSSLMIQLMMTSESIDFRPSGSSMHSCGSPEDYTINNSPSRGSILEKVMDQAPSQELPATE